MKLTLASKSSARAAVLSGAGAPFQTAGSGVEEDVIKRQLLAEGANPKEIAEALAEAKALAVSERAPGLVLGADQTLDLSGTLYDKVETLEAARERLQELRGKPHQLHSAIAVAEAGQIVWRETVSATLTMRDFSDDFLERYLTEEGEAALGSVGCYRLEGPGAQLFAKVQGDYFAILGLPLFGLLEFLRRREVLPA
ncbi:MAG TPA: Maf family protein [Phenylobacterium sp.]